MLIIPGTRWSAVCHRGHVISDLLSFPDATPGEVYRAPASTPILVPPFCSECGAPVVISCDTCSRPLIGRSPGGTYQRPPDNFCYFCGSAMRWASRQDRVRHLENLLEFQELEEATQLTIVEQLAVLAAPVDEATDDDRAVAGSRLRGLAPRLWDAGLPVLQTVLTEAAKRRLGLTDPA